MNIFLYLTTILIWGSTWIGVYFQLGEVPVTVSIFYRFALAAILFLPGLYLLGKLQKTTKQDHPIIFLQGCCLFSFNFICFYNATQYISSGLCAVVFSCATIFNAVNNRVFYKEAIPFRVVIAGFLGSTGLVVLFLPELSAGHIGNDSMKGLALALAGTFLFSLGNMLSKKTSGRSLSPITTNAYGMFYGALVLGLIISVSNQALVITYKASYLGSLLYLSVFGSIVAFSTYLMLVARIGANKAAYCTVMFPIIALFLSSFFEGYKWQISSFIGISLTIAGNIILNTSKLPFISSILKARQSS